jgi:AAA domain
MANILLQTTIVDIPDDWNVGRFSLLADELARAGHEVTTLNRDETTDDSVLSVLDTLDYDQLWLMAVDTGNGLSPGDSAGIMRFRERGGGMLTARDHQDLGSCLVCLGSIGQLNHFHNQNPEPHARRDDQDNPNISWPNYHSGANGEYQPVMADEPAHELLRTDRNPSGRIEWFPAHPHEGAVSAPPEYDFAQVVGRGRSTVSGRTFNLAVALDGETMAKRAQLSGGPLTDGQTAMIRSVLTSRRPVELIVGVAGSGKTTALDVVREAFEQAGHRVVGTSISGQAARTMGAEAGIGESRTIASLLWRIDHGQARLDPSTVVICDEAGMTDDPNMLRLLTETEAAGSKLIVVGDHRQLGAVGPGGSLGALVNRHDSSVHALRENVRQADPQERRILAHLRWQRRTGGQLVRRTRSDHHREQSRPGPRSDRRRLGQRRRRRAAVDDNGVAKSERSRPKCASARRYVPSRPAQRTGTAGRRTCLPGRGSHRHPRPVRRRPSGHLPEGTNHLRQPRRRQSHRADGRRSPRTLSGPTRSERTSSPSGTPQRFIESKAPPSTPPTSSSTVETESSDTSP